MKTRSGGSHDEDERKPKILSATLKTLHVECEKDDKKTKTYIPCFASQVSK